VSYVARLILEDDFGGQFWFFAPNPKNQIQRQNKILFSFHLHSSLLVSSGLVSSTPAATGVVSSSLVFSSPDRWPPSVFFLVHIFVHFGLGFKSLLWLAIWFCLFSSFTWFSSKRKCFVWLKCLCCMISIWGWVLWNKGWSFMVFFVKREHLYLVWRFMFWGKPLLVWFLLH